jgi:hypothetical protein
VIINGFAMFYGFILQKGNEKIILQNYWTDFIPFWYNSKISARYMNAYFLATDKLLEFLHQSGMDSAPAPQNRCFAVDEKERIRKIEPFAIEDIKTMQAQIENARPDSTCRHGNIN